MNKGTAGTILIADDESEITGILSRFLSREGYEPIVASNGNQALGKAKVQIPDILLLDVNMPEMNGFEVCRRLREDPSTSLIPILMLTARGGTDEKVHGLSLGADDYLPKPFEFKELLARIQNLLRRREKMISANPLTQLPGSPSIQKEIESRIATGEKFAVAYLDIDHFKAYNDAYGYHQGDQVIVWTARLLRDTLQDCPRSSEKRAPFLGHIGGDDFIVVGDLDEMNFLAKTVPLLFDQNRKKWYNWKHRFQNGIETEDRQGNRKKFPLMTITTAVALNEKRKLAHYGEISHILSELKKHAKNRTTQESSFVIFDRRSS